MSNYLQDEVEAELISKLKRAKERIEQLERVSVALRDDLILRADIGTFDGDHNVQASASIWRNFLEALKNDN